jgi:hypothetical protein
VSRYQDAGLQNDLNSLEEWENSWQMAFHPEKCVVIRVSNKRKPINAQYTIHEVDSSKYPYYFVLVETTGSHQRTVWH